MEWEEEGKDEVNELDGWEDIIVELGLVISVKDWGVEEVIREVEKEEV